MILALVAKGKKTIACGMLALIYLETVIPSYALGSNTPVAYTKGKAVVNPGVLKKPVAVKPAVTAAAVTPRAAAKGNIGGPTQPESQAFHSANNDNMVDLFSGDFTYNIPLMDVGGYPITIGYNSGISMDQEASWVGLGWNINPGTITRNMRGLPDDFNGRDTIVKTATIKENKTIGGSTGGDIEVVGLPLSIPKSGQDTAKFGLDFGVSMGLFHNTYQGWGMEYGLNASINVGRSGMGGLSGGLALSNNSQEGFTVSPSFSVHAGMEATKEHGGFDGSVSIGSAYNSRSGIKGLQLSSGLQQTRVVEKNVNEMTDDGPVVSRKDFVASRGSTFSSFISFARPSYLPTISLPYTSKNTTVTIKVGFETKVVHPNFFASGYVSKQYIAPEDRRREYPAFGYLNYQNGAANPGALMDFNREKDIPYRDKPAVPHIAVPSYTYDIFAMSGEGTGGSFRAYRSDVGFVYDHAMRTKDASERYSGDIGFGDLVHAGVDLNFTRSFTQTGIWGAQNPLASLIAFKKTDSVFEAAYFRNPGEKTVNSKEFYNTIGGDDVVAADIYQAGRSSSVISTTHRLSRYKNGRLVEKIPLPDAVIKKERDKRTQVISYLTAKEASEAGLSKYIDNYEMNRFELNNKSCEIVVPEDKPDPRQGLWGKYYYYNYSNGDKDGNWSNLIYEKLDPILRFYRQKKGKAPKYDINIGKPVNAIELGDRFSVNWNGVIKAPTTGAYTFRFSTDDGVIAHLEDLELVSHWREQSSEPWNDGIATVNLLAGEQYKFDMRYFQTTKSYVVNLYWQYPGQPEQLIPKEYMSPPSVPVDEFNDGIISRERRVNGFRKENHISEIDVLNADGRRYVYGIPVYNLKQKDVTFSVDAAGGNNREGLVKYGPTDDTPENDKGMDHYFNSEEIPAYAHSFLLTGILSPDYADLTGNGISPDDPGDAIKFNYSKIAGINNTYKWRAPYKDSATYNEGLKTDNRDDKGSYVYGEKELWYLHSVESKNMIATFKLSNREDLLQIDQQGHKQTDHVAKKLDEINLYSKADFMKNGTKAVPIKTVHFGYSYRLCRGINAPVNDSGKLSLDTIWFSYNGNNKGKRNPYIFHYNNNNPRYNIKSYDRWGNFKDPLQNPGSTIDKLISNSDYPYALQDSTLAAQNAVAWTMDDIELPSGGRIKVTYESDDYAFVQNKRAMQLLKVAGFSVAAPTSLASLNNQMYGSADHLYVAINVPDPVTSVQELRYKYLEGIEKIYFKLFVQMPTDRYGSGGEYVPCYATIDPSGEAGFINNGKTIWVKLKGVDGAGKDGDMSPLVKAATQYLRLNLPSKAYPGSDIGDELDLDVAVRILIAMGGNITNAFRSFDNIARAKGWAKEVDTSRTLARLTNPRFKKYGGGLRVKRLETYDHWNVMARQKESVYGQEYQYTTTREVNGQPMEISSGVASYEPMLGSEENPWHLPIEYQEQVSLLAPVTQGYTEEPLGESFFPGASVGYSKVRVRSIHTKKRRSANGLAETCFYTGYDFPTLTEMTPITDDSKKRFKPLLANLLRINARQYLTVSQGFKVELNDMTGKVRSQATYAETDFNTPVTYTENFYRVDNQNVEYKHLDNTVMAISPQGIIDPEASIGKDVELMMDMREQRSVTNGNNFNVNGDFFSFSLPPVWLIPSLLSLAQREETMFRSAAATKVINRHGILDSTIVIEKGSKVVTQNLLFDSETGDPVLTRTQNEFDDTIFHFTYPSGWAYDGMSGAYKNIGLVIDHVTMRNGKIISGLSDQLLNRYFSPGDELLIWSKPKTGGIGCNIEIATFPVSGQLWAVDANAFNGGTTDLYFVDRDGQPFSGGDMTLKVIRSGRKNISTSVGAVNMLRNPLVSTVVNGQQVWALQINDNSKVIDATATEFQQQWKVTDKKNVSYVTNCVPMSYEQYIEDSECQPVPYQNRAMTDTFYKNDCGPKGVTPPFVYYVPEGTYSSLVSQAQADSLAQDDIDSTGQDYTNENSYCTYTNEEMKKSFTKNDCPGDTLSGDCGAIGTISSVIYTVPAGKYTSTISLEDANARALQELNYYGQAYANSNGECTYYNIETARAFLKNDCTSGTGSTEIYRVPARTYTSTESQEQADSLAEADIRENGQAYANSTGNCGPTSLLRIDQKSGAPAVSTAFQVGVTEDGGTGTGGADQIETDNLPVQKQIMVASGKLCTVAVLHQGPISVSVNGVVKKSNASGTLTFGPLEATQGIFSPITVLVWGYEE